LVIVPGAPCSNADQRLPTLACGCIGYRVRMQVLMASLPLFGRV